MVVAACHKVKCIECSTDKCYNLPRRTCVWPTIIIISRTQNFNRKNQTDIETENETTETENNTRTDTHSMSYKPYCSQCVSVHLRLLIVMHLLFFAARNGEKKCAWLPYTYAIKLVYICTLLIHIQKCNVFIHGYSEINCWFLFQFWLNRIGSDRFWFDFIWFYFEFFPFFILQIRKCVSACAHMAHTHDNNNNNKHPNEMN